MDERVDNSEIGHQQMMTPEDERAAIRQYVERWKRLGPELERMKATELSTMTEDERRRKSRLMVDLARRLPRESKPSGMVEQQRLFARARS